jgi:GT2 family glycosyltransferase
MDCNGDNIFISIIIPCYNGADTISGLLSSLQGQRCDRKWEIVVADNRSTDNLREVVEHFQRQMPNLRLIDAFERQGQPYALNKGVSESRGSVLTFCDADDETCEGWLAAMARALEKHDLVAARFDFEKLNPSWTLRYRKNQQTTGLQQYTNPPYLPHAGGGSLGVKRWVFDKVGGFDEAFPALHDTDFCWKAQLAGVSLNFVPDAVMHIRLRDTMSGIFRQGSYYGEYNVKLYTRYRKLGMPKLSWLPGARQWKKILRQLPRLRHAEERPLILRQLGWRYGRLKGCLKYHTTAL